MLINDSNTATNMNDFVNDYNESSLTANPTLRQATRAGVFSGITAPFQGINDIGQSLDILPRHNWLDTLYQKWQTESAQTNGLFDKSANFVGNLAGSIINPINLVTGAVGGVAARAGASLLSDGLSISEPLAARAVQSSLTAGGAAAGGLALPTIAGNYNPSKNSIDWYGVAKDSTYNFGIGMAIPAVPFAAGIVGSKVSDYFASKAADNAASSVETTPTQLTASQLDQAKKDGVINDDEHAFLSAYQQGAPNSDLIDQAQRLIEKSNGDIPVDQDGAHVTIFNKEDVENLNNAMLDQSVSQVPDELKTALSDYISSKSLDRLSLNDTAMNGLKGFVSSMEDREGFAEKEAERVQKSANTRDIKPGKLPKTLQLKHIARSIAKGESDLDDHPMTDEVVHYAKQEHLIKQGVKDRKGLSYPSLTEEINQLHTRLSGDNYGLLDENNIDQRRKVAAFNRLRTLARYNKHAMGVLKKVLVKNTHAGQQYYKAVAQQLIDHAERGAQSSASPQQVADYLQARMEASKPSVRETPLPPEREAATGIEGAESLQNSLDKQQRDYLKDMATQLDETINYAKSIEKSDDPLEKFMQCAQGVSESG